MIDLSKYDGEKLRIKYDDGAQIEAIREEFMLGDNYDKEFNSMAIQYFNLK